LGDTLARWWVDVATAIHFYEAILATLAIVVWHFYQVFFDPDVYPMNWAWWDGKMPGGEHYRHEHGLERDRDTAEFAPSLERRASLRARMGVQAEFVWLAAGRIAAAKDYPNLLRAFARVHAAAAHARLWIAGEAMGNGLTAMQALTAELGLADAVRWLGLRRDMPALFDAADGFMLASAWEGMPLAVGEAMAMEKPVVATDVGGVRELMGEVGAIVPAKSPEGLAASMLALMRSTPEARASLGCAARAHIQENFSIEARADEWETLYRGVLERKF
jgi:glycosyltransferase involved in cell wall biosynthesis